MIAPVTAVTAGHIDHGKTALVRALTGTDTDRLAEEKRRGISIELGFAQLDLGGRRISLIDVPGHERFVRTMIAGAGGVDLFLMVIAADDGVMPQTIEHATILRSLGVEAGVVALTKCDRADPPRIERADSAARRLLPGSMPIHVDSLGGEGVGRLRTAIAEVAADIGAADPPEDSSSVALHIDRAFTVAGHGTVVTGTLRCGTVSRGQRLLLLPRGQEVRVRQVQVHDRPVERADAHQRVAVNLTGVDRTSVSRGDVLAGADTHLTPSYRLDVELLTTARRPAPRERLQIHHGTRESPARIVDLGDDRLQLRLESPLIAAPGDRVVMRAISHPDTLGGARVIDPAPQRRGPGSDRREPVHEAPAVENQRPPSGHRRTRPGSQVGPGPPRLALRVLVLLREDGRRPRGSRALAESLSVDHDVLLGVLGGLVEAGELVRLKRDLWYPTAELEGLRGRAAELAGREDGVTVAELRDELGVSRRYALALLDHLDATLVTVRLDDTHRLRRSGVNGPRD